MINSVLPRTDNISKKKNKLAMKQRNCFVLPCSEGGHLDYAASWLRPQSLRNKDR